jgi:diphthamide biosynthesis methyltransferase
MFPTSRSTKHCMVYCGDDICDCSKNPKYGVFNTMKSTLAAKKPHFDKFELKETLENGVHTITFTKVDETERTMKATLLTEYMPKKDMSKLLVEQTNKRPDNDDLLTVWDTEEKGWRSIRVSSIKKLIKWV